MAAVNDDSKESVSLSFCSSALSLEQQQLKNLLDEICHPRISAFAFSILLYTYIYLMMYSLGGAPDNYWLTPSGVCNLSRWFSNQAQEKELWKMLGQ